MSHWTSRRAILRDLARAQGGYGVSDPLSHTLGARDRPPARCIEEETEEEYFRHCVGDSAVAVKPDLGLIQQMLDMVRDMDAPDAEINANNVPVISKLNPTSTEFIPRSALSQHAKDRVPRTHAHPAAAPVVPPVAAPAPRKRLRQRNIALESILQAIETRRQRNDSDVQGSDGPRKLLKPTDLVPHIQENGSEGPSIPTNGVDAKETERATPLATKTFDERSERNVKDEALEKVTDWMTQMMSPVAANAQSRYTLSLDSATMFKKKSKAVKPQSSAPTPRGVRGVRGGRGGCYVPSTQASRYYQQYLEKSQLMDALNDDIWTKAEKEMKEIDDKKRREAASRDLDAHARAQPGPGPDPDSPEDAISNGRLDPLRAVRLPQHRHLMQGPGAEQCVVCAALVLRSDRGPTLLQRMDTVSDLSLALGAPGSLQMQTVSESSE